MVVSEIESGNIDTVTGYNVCVCTMSNLGVTTTTLNVTLVVHYVTLTFVHMLACRTLLALIKYLLTRSQVAYTAKYTATYLHAGLFLLDRNKHFTNPAVFSQQPS